MRFVVAVVLALAGLWVLAPAASAEPSPRCFALPPMCDPGYVAICGCTGFSASSCVWACFRKG